MTDLDSLAPNYCLAQQRWPDAPTLTKCYEALSVCFSGNAHGLVEHVKSFIESVCITIMDEFGKPSPSSKPNSTALLKEALSALGLSNTKGATKLDAVLSGFNKLSDALSAMRNETGPVAHGKNGFLDSITIDHARTFLHVGDAILGILLNALEGKEPDITLTHEPYDTFKCYNDRIDRNASIQAQVDEEGDGPVVVFSVSPGSYEETIELRIEPSRLLYGTDRQAYIEVLKATNAVPGVAVDEEHKEVTTSEPEKRPSIRPVEATRPYTVVISVYSGPLNGLRSRLEEFLDSKGVNTAATGDGEKQLLDSLLATVDKNMTLDWKNRENIQARLKVACKRVFISFGFEAQKADKVAKGMVDWLREQV